MMKKARFPGYHEELITFLPTWKRVATNDTEFVNKKNQSPSFTDRIIFKNNNVAQAEVKYFAY